MSSQAFNYNELPARHIRLLQLLPGTASDALECRISTTSLDENPRYNAVSYVWGTTAPPVFLDCGSGRIQITSNLQSALQRIRNEDQARVLWADQVCINQASKMERSAQVSMMGEIFKRAECVVMWLGPDDETHPVAPLAARMMSHLAKRPKQEIFAREAPTDERLLQHGLPSLAAPEWQALNALFDLPFFKRVWIVQEVQLAASRQMLWGATSLSWENLDDAVGFIMSNEQLYAHHAAPLKQRDLTAVGWLLGTLNDWVLVMPMVYSREATDLRDKVFGVQGLLESAQVPMELRPDYSKSLLDVFMALAKFLIIKYDALTLVLREAGTLNHDLVGLGLLDWPSWTPQWKTVDLLPLSAGMPHFQADNGTYMQVASPPSNLRSLQVAGVIVDEIKHVLNYEASTDIESMTDVIAYINQAWELCRTYSNALDTVQTPLIKQLLSPLVGGSYNQTRRGVNSTAWHDVLYGEFAKFWGLHHIPGLEGRPSNLEDLTEKLQIGYAALFAYRYLHVTYEHVGDERFEAAVREVQQSDHPIPPYWMQRVEQVRDIVRAAFPDEREYEAAMRMLMPFLVVKTDNMHFFRRCRDSVNRRLFFISENGKTGLVPGNAKPDDVVVIFFGARVPYALRRLDNGCYVLLGECYLEGVMQGEYIEWLQQIDGLMEARLIFQLV